MARGLEYISLKQHSYGEISYLNELYSVEDFIPKIYEFHGDYVVDVPEGFTCIG